MNTTLTCVTIESMIWLATLVCIMLIIIATTEAGDERKAHELSIFAFPASHVLLLT